MSKNQEDQSWAGWKKYIAEGYRYMVDEAWQLGIDAKNEGYNLYSEATGYFFCLIKSLLKSFFMIEFFNFVGGIGGIAYDVYMADKWAVTEKNSEKDKDENSDPDRKEKSDIPLFSVEEFHRSEPQALPALLQEHNDGKLQISNTEKSDLPL